MAPLPRELRKILEDAVVKARGAAEEAASAAFVTLGVQDERPHASLTQEDRALRLALRAKLHQLGSVKALVSEIAYQHWHRMLFARFLIENGLLIHPEYEVAVSMEELTDLAGEEGEADHWVLAADFASKMLPAIFRIDDPELALRFAPEGRQALEQRLACLPKEVFTADDALGWVYQFWQSERKKQVNSSETKIGAAELPAVTQLFTEDYMVRFLLENSLGAWWAAHHPASPLIERFAYLRFTDEGVPAAGSFDEWPRTVAEVTVMDPCCGSGHFLTTAFEMLAAMRMEEEGLSAARAGDAVISENLFGLELDPRCTQIAAFALALSAWKHGGYREPPEPNIACSGTPVKGQLEEWKKLAEGDERLENALVALHEQFRNAPELGSLIDPRRATEEGRLFEVDFEEVAPLLAKLLEREHNPGAQVAGWAAAGIARAASLLAGSYTLVVTNVPYLSRSKQGETLRRYSSWVLPEAQGDLAFSMLGRCCSLASPEGCCGVVAPQTWLFLQTHRRFRKRMLEEVSWDLVARLGSGAFEAISGEVVNVVLWLGRMTRPGQDHSCAGVDVSSIAGAAAKSQQLRAGALETVNQAQVLENPDSRFSFQVVSGLAMLSEFADSAQGICTGDYSRFGRLFWELEEISGSWSRQLSTAPGGDAWGGREHALLWEDGEGELLSFVRERLGEGRESAWIRGVEFLGKVGVGITQAGGLAASRFSGELFDNNLAVIVPKNPKHLAALWAYCVSPDFVNAVRRVDANWKVSNLTLLKVPFDLEHWTKVAEEIYPAGLPESHSNDPTQWLFKGDLADSTDPLQVVVARLLGYAWPHQGPDDLDALADPDGIVCLPSVAGEHPASERLRELLEKAFGSAWSQSKLSKLLTASGSPDLETWLRDSFFAAHAKLFHNRPFIWHIWDGRKDGFSALVNYHRLDAKLLSRLTHTILGDWITQQRAQAKADTPGAEPRLAAALDLQARLGLILEGEPPYDIFVRWKPLAEQPIGWDPDLNDGVRLNIRPFIEAKVLRSKFTIHWKKDRGKDPDGSERLNDLHLTRAEKEAAREKARG